MHPFLTLYALHAAELLPRLRAAGLTGDPVRHLLTHARQAPTITLGGDHTITVNTSGDDTFTATVSGPPGWPDATYHAPIPAGPLRGQAARDAARTALTGRPHPLPEPTFETRRAALTGILDQLDFIPYDTGGGCMALMAETPSPGYVLLTTLDGTTMPVHPDHGLMIGMYDDNGDEMLLYTHPACVDLAILDERGVHTGQVHLSTHDEPALAIHALLGTLGAPAGTHLAPLPPHHLTP